MQQLADLGSQQQDSFGALLREVDANIAAWIDGMAYAVWDKREGGFALGARETQPEIKETTKDDAKAEVATESSEKKSDE